MPGPDPTDEQAELAAAEAARIGSSPTSDPPPIAPERPLIETGQGEAEGFEQAEKELVEHATHSDQHAARRVIQDAALEAADDARAAEAGEADLERSSERGEQL